MENKGKTLDFPILSPRVATALYSRPQPIKAAYEQMQRKKYINTIYYDLKAIYAAYETKLLLFFKGKAVQQLFCCLPVWQILVHKADKVFPVVWNKKMRKLMRDNIIKTFSRFFCQRGI